MGGQNQRQGRETKAKSDPVSVEPLRLDLQNKKLWKGKACLPLSKRPFEVLCYLVKRKGQLVEKEELLRMFWSSNVYEEALTRCLSDIRRVLNEDAHSPRYIETVYGYGYRFIGLLAEASTAPAPSSLLPSTPEPERRNIPAPQPETWSLKSETVLVGREIELARLQRCLEKALRGERQIVFVTGEAGIGKTTLVRAFLDQVAIAGEIAIGRGQCIEQYGPGEAYLPVLEALGRLCRDPHGAFLLEWMRQHLPTWLVQMPALLSPTEREELQYKVQGTARERMLREMSEGIEQLTQQFPFVLLLEDVHWSDASTLDLLASVARRQEPARLLIIATYRPEEGLEEGHPLKALTQELRGHGLCYSLALPPLSDAAVAGYLEQRFPASALPTRLPQLLHRMTGGNPLFLVAVIEDLIERSILAQTEGTWGVQGEIESVGTETPENIRQLLSKQIERLGLEERRLLQAASVVGFEFATAAIAAALEAKSTDVEERCAALERHQRFVRSAGLSEWPDGTRTPRYRFRHALYQALWNERLTLNQRQQLHQRIGERLEAAYGNRVHEIAAELALHFEQGRDYQRAVRYLQQAAQNALRRSANAEAIQHASRGLELLKTLPQTSERPQQELALQITLGVPLLMTRGHTDPKVEQVYAHARELCRQVGETPQLLQVLYGLRRFYFVKGDRRAAHELGEQIFSVVQRMHEPLLLMWGHYLLGDTLFYAGDLIAAQDHLEQGVAFNVPQDHRSWVFLYGYDQKMGGLACLARTLWLLGYPDQARQRNQEALAQGQKSLHPFSLASGLIYAAVVHQFCQELQAVQEQAEAAIALSHEQGFPFFEAWGHLLRGWTLGRQGQAEEGLRLMQRGLAVFQMAGAEISRPHNLALLAEGYLTAGQTETGLHTVVEALMVGDKNDDHSYEAELYRLKGELTLQQENQKSKPYPEPSRRSKGQKAKIPTTQHPAPSDQAEAEAEACFHKAIAIAREQSAKSLELRATMSLAGLWQRQGKKKQAHKMLAEIYDWFTEGFGTVDLKAAKALLQELR